MLFLEKLCGPRSIKIGIVEVYIEKTNIFKNIFKNINNIQYLNVYTSTIIKCIYDCVLEVVGKGTAMQPLLPEDTM